jgi:cell division protein FtsQ
MYSAVRAFIELPFFALREVWVLGSVHRIEASELERVIRRDLRGNFFTLNLSDARTAFEKVPWVRSASLSRAWPNTLVVRIEEQVPLARWGKDQLINIHGERFSGTAHASLPDFVGPDGSESEMTRQYRAFLRALEPIATVPTAVRLSERGAWQITLSNDLDLELGREDMEARLKKFVEVYPQFVTLTDADSQRLDLRYDNGFAMTRIAGNNERSE